MARPIEPISVSPDELNELYAMVSSHKLEHRYVQRARVILMSTEVTPIRTISTTVGMSISSITKWRRRFRKFRLAGLVDKTGRGRPPAYSAQDRVRIVNAACGNPKGGRSRCTQRGIAAKLGMSQSTVNRALKAEELRPHKTHYWCGKSTDPEFESKMLTIVGLYLRPPDNALVLCVDEKTQIQALDRSQPVLPLKKHYPKRMTTTYKRHGTVALIAALAVHTGKITADPIKSTSGDTFLRFLKKLYRKYPHRKLHIIADNLASHKTPAVRDWISSHSRVEIHYTPTYSSWLNQVEIWFNILTRGVITGGVWKSTKQLVSQIIEFIDTYNRTSAKPFEWIYNGTKAA